MSMEPLISDFADDADMAELLHEFLVSVEQTCVRLREGLEAGDVEAVRRIGHQMKGAGGGYGYDELSNVGDILESTVADAKAITVEVRIAADKFLATCARALAGLAQTESSGS